MYRTNNLEIEVLPNKTVKIKNNREDERIYLLDDQQLYYLFKEGGKQWKISTANGGYDQISFNVTRRHLSSAGGQINTYIDLHDYELLMFDLQMSIYIITDIDIDDLI